MVFMIRNKTADRYLPVLFTTERAAREYAAAFSNGQLWEPMCPSLLDEDAVREIVALDPNPRR